MKRPSLVLLLLAETKPNIIVILTDDLGWADIGSQGINNDIRTPNIDTLAAGGLRATNGYVTAPQCVPSRAGLSELELFSPRMSLGKL